MRPVLNARPASTLHPPPEPASLSPMHVVNRARPNAVALETTLLAHGVPRDAARDLARDLQADIRAEGAEPAIVGLVAGVPTIGMTDAELDDMLAHQHLHKINTANLGIAMRSGDHGATTVSATMELAAAAGVPVFATGGLGGVHPGLGERLDVSADLTALARFPVCVVCSGVKSILDVASTREALETLGIPVVGVGCDSFPAFYVPESLEPLDARIDDLPELATFVQSELARTHRAVVVAQPPPPDLAIGETEFATWLDEATRRAGDAGSTGRSRTPAILEALHEVSGGRTLQTNIALVRANARLAAKIRGLMR